MNGLMTVLRKELKCFLGSDKSTFFLYALLSVIWSFMLLSDGAVSGSAVTERLWIVFFAVIVGANFSNAAFISERVSGTLEILITSGLSRSAILYGKMAFITLMTSAIGAACAALAFLWSALSAGLVLSYPLGACDVAAYIAVAYLNAAAGAYLSVRMGNPRFLHFINLFMIGAIVALYGAASAYFNAHPLTLAAVFLLTGGIFTFLAKREFEGERIIRPVVF
jgi:ABC-type Na+ efflux pump permease subunit